jgi:hypothetical protein
MLHAVLVLLLSHMHTCECICIRITTPTAAGVVEQVRYPSVPAENTFKSRYT